MPQKVHHSDLPAAPTAPTPDIVQRHKQMADVAHLAGVATSTVSRALGGSPLVNEETCKRRPHRQCRSGTSGCSLRDAVDGVNAAAQFNMIEGPETLDEMVDALKGEFSGDALYNKIISSAKADLADIAKTVATSCFAAGTLVHTREDTSAIENIAIGDWVLSQPEGRGERAFKRVVRTQSFGEKAVIRVRVTDTGTAAEKQQNLIVTRNHPFFVVGYNPEIVDLDHDGSYAQKTGWLRADLLEYGALLELANGDIVQVSLVQPIWRTRTDGVGWIEPTPGGGLGWLIDMRNGVVVEDMTALCRNDFSDDVDFGGRDLFEELADQFAYKCKVFNFEVEDFHTYYVGEMGVWAHNANCFEDVVSGLKKGESYRFAEYQSLPAIERYRMRS